MIQSIRKRLSKWKGRYLSFVGRLTLIKSIITVVSLLYLSLFKLYSKVRNDIKKIRKEFLWDRGQNNRKVAWLVGRTSVNLEG